MPHSFLTLSEYCVKGRTQRRNCTELNWTDQWASSVHFSSIQLCRCVRTFKIGPTFADVTTTGKDVARTCVDIHAVIQLVAYASPCTTLRLRQRHTWYCWYLCQRLTDLQNSFTATLFGQLAITWLLTIPPRFLRRYTKPKFSKIIKIIIIFT